jgi:hypothetical protein
MKSNKVSIANAASPIRKPKVSQFCVQHKWSYYLLIYNIIIQTDFYIKISTFCRTHKNSLVFINFYIENFIFFVIIVKFKN